MDASQFMTLRDNSSNFIHSLPSPTYLCYINNALSVKKKKIFNPFKNSD